MGLFKMTVIFPQANESCTDKAVFRSGGGFAGGGGGVEAESKGMDYAEDGGEFWISVRAESAIETFAGEAGFAGDFGHAAGACDDSEGVGDETKKQRPVVLGITMFDTYCHGKEIHYQH